jgi:hypothetical protein
MGRHYQIATISFVWPFHPFNVDINNSTLEKSNERAHVLHYIRARAVKEHLPYLVCLSLSLSYLSKTYTSLVHTAQPNRKDSIVPFLLFSHLSHLKFQRPSLGLFQRYVGLYFCLHSHPSIASEDFFQHAKRYRSSFAIVRPQQISSLGIATSRSEGEENCASQNVL